MNRPRLVVALSPTQVARQFRATSGVDVSADRPTAGTSAFAASALDRAGNPIVQRCNSAVTATPSVAVRVTIEMTFSLR